MDNCTSICIFLHRIPGTFSLKTVNSKHSTQIQRMMCRPSGTCRLWSSGFLGCPRSSTDKPCQDIREKLLGRHAECISEPLLGDHDHLLARGLWYEPLSRAPNDLDSSIYPTGTLADALGTVLLPRSGILQWDPGPCRDVLSSQAMGRSLDPETWNLQPWEEHPWVPIPWSSFLASTYSRLQEVRILV